jgi:hypothetical protein
LKARKALKRSPTKKALKSSAVAPQRNSQIGDLKFQM